MDTGLCGVKKRADKAENADKADKADKTDKADKADKADKTDRTDKTVGAAGLLREKLPGKTPPSTLRTGLMRSGRQREKMPAFCCI